MAQMSCKKCGIVGTLDLFTKDRSRPSGYKNICRPCHATNQQRWRDENPDKSLERSRKSRERSVTFVPGTSYAEKRDTLDRIKRSRTCFFCGEDEPVALDFHHKDADEKVFTISRKIHKNLTILLEEVAKCEVVCANCHRKLHAGLIQF